MSESNQPRVPEQIPGNAIDPNNIKSAGKLGYISSIICFIPFVNIVGCILVLISLRRLSREYRDESIWRNSLRGMIIFIIGGVIGGFVAGIVVENSSFYTTLQIAAVVAYPFAIVSMRYIRNAYYALAERSGVSNFREAGKWFWRVGLTEIILLVSGIFWLVAVYDQMMGFDKLRKLAPFAMAPTS